MASEPETHENWVLGAKALGYLREGLQTFVGDNVLRHRDRTVQKLSDTFPPGSPIQCNECTCQNLLPEHVVPNRTCNRKTCIQLTIGKCFGSKQNGRRKCPNGICGKMYDAIVHLHRFKDPLWVNTDPSKWCSDQAGWSFARCFLQAQRSNTSSADTEVGDLLAMILFDVAFQNEVACGLNSKRNIFSRAREIRNEIMNSVRQELCFSKLLLYTHELICVLEDPRCLINDPRAQESVRSLKKIRNRRCQIYTTLVKNEGEVSSSAHTSSPAEKAERDNRLYSLFQPSEINVQGRLKELDEQTVTDLLDCCGTSRHVGGFGEIFVSETKIPGLNMQIAIKKVQLETGAEALKMRSITNEKLASRTMHFGIVPLLALREDTQNMSYYFVSPYFENGDLFEAIKYDNEKLDEGAAATLDPGKRLRILFHIASAIDFLHTPVKGFRETILHMDIKTLNIVLDKNYNARLIDFGLAREMREGEQAIHTTTKELAHTEGYYRTMKGQKLTKHADYYNFGVVIRELLTGLPFHDEKKRDPEQLRNLNDLKIKAELKAMWMNERKLPIQIAEELIQLSVDCIKDADLKRISSQYIVSELTNKVNSMNEKRWAGKSKSGDKNDNRSGVTNDNRFEDANDNRSGDTNDSRSGDTNDNRSGDTNDNRSGDTNDNRSGDTNDNRSGDTKDNRSGDKNDNRSGDKNDKPRCELCLANTAVEDKMLAHAASCRCNLKICVACMRNSYLNPIRCHSCDADIKPIIGQDWGAILIAGDGDEIFKDDVAEIKTVITSKWPLVMGIRESMVRTIYPENPGKECIKSRLNSAISSLNENNAIKTILIYYSGHYCSKAIEGGNVEGFKLGGKGEYLSAVELQLMLSPFLKSSAEYKSTVVTSRRLIIFLDCCTPPSFLSMPAEDTQTSDVEHQAGFSQETGQSGDAQSKSKNKSGTMDGSKRLPVLSFKDPGDYSIVQMNACRHTQRISGTSFRKFLVQALTRQAMQEQCHVNTTGGSDVECRDCCLAGDFITMQDLRNYIKKHFEKCSLPYEPVVHDHNVSTHDAEIGYVVNFSAELRFSYKFKNRTTSGSVAKQIFSDMLPLKTVLYDNFFNEMKKEGEIQDPIPSKAEFFDIMSIEIERGPKKKDKEELDTIEKITGAWNSKRELLISLREIPEIRHGKVGIFLVDDKASSLLSILSSSTYAKKSNDSSGIIFSIAAERLRQLHAALEDKDKELKHHVADVINTIENHPECDGIKVKELQVIFPAESDSQSLLRDDFVCFQISCQ